MINVEFYWDTHDKRMGTPSHDLSSIRINRAHTPNDEVLGVVAHEATHILLHLNSRKKHYTPAEKEYQAYMVEYNITKSIQAKYRLNKFRKILKKENRNLTPLREEVRRIYPEILRISSLLRSHPFITNKNFIER